MTAGGSLRFDLSTSHLSGNDQVVVSGGNLSVSSATVIHIKALSGAANLSTAGDYVLCSVAGTTTMATTPVLAWDGTTPANYLNYSVAKVGNNLSVVQDGVEAMDFLRQKGEYKKTEAVPPQPSDADRLQVYAA